MGARQIYDSLKDQIIHGVYGTDGSLPSSRSLAGELGVSRTTVTVAYEQLAAEGFITVRQGARPRVSPSAINHRSQTRAQRRRSDIKISSYAKRLEGIPLRPTSRDRYKVADFRYGDLSPSDFPILAWKRAMVDAITQRPERLAYDDPRGSRRLRIALQGYLWRARTLRCELDQIIIVNGSQQGLDLCARLLLDEEDRFVIENPCYAMARHIFAATGAKPISIGVDQDGLRTEGLAGTFARLAYVTPSHQFPLGGVMTIGRRHQLLAWAQQSNAYIIEDDYDSEYRYDIDPVPPLHGLDDNDNVIYLGTVSKTLSPTMRIGYLIVPPRLQELFATAKQIVDRHTSMSDQTALAALFESGVYESHVRKIRRRNSERRATLLKALYQAFGSDVTVEGADAGLHVVIWFQVPLSMEGDLIEKTRELGIGVHSVMPLYDPHIDKAQPRRVGLVIGYAALDTRQIQRGVTLLRQAIDRLHGKSIAS
jgi:GntR family transcriptional regulator/MocR family aminotransferase